MASGAVSRIIKGRLAAVTLAVALGVLPAACGGDPDPVAATPTPANVPAPDLSMACAILNCTCEKTGKGFFDDDVTTPVLWTDRGAAYCPANHRLRKVD